MHQTTISIHEQSTSLTVRTKQLIRPLNQLSDFVKSELPLLLERLRANPSIKELLSERLVQILSNTDPVLRLSEIKQQSELAVAALDVAMIVTACRRHSINIPERLKAAHKIAADRMKIPECLTYELIIRSNPAQDTRTFCTGRTGRAEKFFYLDHERVERVLAKAVTAARRARNLLSHENYEKAAPLIKLATELHAQSIEKMYRFRQRKSIALDDFQIFRQYFDRFDGHPGPSGLYSPGEHGFRIIAFGAVLSDRIKLIQNQTHYFPSKSRKLLASVINHALTGESLFQLALTAPVAIRETVHKLVSQICEDMLQHLGFVRHFVGSAAQGTAGMNFEFLTKGYERSCTARDTLGLTLEGKQK